VVDRIENSNDNRLIDTSAVVIDAFRDTFDLNFATPTLL
jgi:hypothetical protein